MVVVFESVWDITNTSIIVELLYDYCTVLNSRTSTSIFFLSKVQHRDCGCDDSQIHSCIHSDTTGAESHDENETDVVKQNSDRLKLIFEFVLAT